MVSIPLCDWCGEKEVGSVSGGHFHYCSDECAGAEEEAEYEAQLQYDSMAGEVAAELANLRWFEERGGWPDDPRGN